MHEDCRPPKTLFLLGARGTGKTTWIRQHFPTAPTYDLILTSESLRLNRDPGLLRAECSALPDGDDADLDALRTRRRAHDEAYVRWGRDCLGWALWGFRAPT